MSQPFRLSDGRIDRARNLSFTWNGKRLMGHPGDTLASALLANGERLVARSFKYHRPRGIFSAGSEEPSALVTLRSGAHAEPNTRAPVIELFDGLEASSQNHRGPLKWDLMAANDLLAPFLGAGFYYKTFMWPAKFWERVYEPIIRASAGLGALSGQPDPDAYDHGWLHADLLIVGAGPTGLAAARAFARTGLRVILADEDFLPGGRLNAETYSVEDQPAPEWAAAATAELAAMPNVRLMRRTSVIGAWDHGTYGALERCTDHLRTSGGKPRQILWHITAGACLLAAGSTERSIAFAGNDRPGVMLSGAVRTYANRFAAAPGQRVAIFTNNDTGWQTAADLTAKGVRIAAIVDTRESVPFTSNARSILGGQVIDTRGRSGLAAIKVRAANGEAEWIDADCLAVSGGWSPNVHLTCHQRGRPVYNPDLAAFVPGADLPVGMQVAGAANGAMTLSRCLTAGHEAATTIARGMGKTIRSAPPRAEDEPAEISAFWHVSGKKRAWIDLQNDVTTKDVKLSHQEGFHAVEHLKRYTTLGMATDQGKTSNVLGLAIMAEAAGKSIAETGTTIFRPPYSPVPIGAFAGRARGKHFRPTRLPPSHAWAAENGASFTEAGQWLRAEWYTRRGESGWRDSVDREVISTRNSAGICDVSTLGKIDIQGRDAATFLNRVYANPFAKLAVGKTRYGLMLREDGFAYDDGTTARLSETQFIMTTTTANAGLVMRNLEFARQCLWPELDVHLTSITDNWAQYAIAGPNSRALLSKITDQDLTSEAFPFMACAEVTALGLPARLFRISFSGELAYEIAFPARYGDAAIRALMAEGAEFDLTPYGTEALSVMRIEKGHPAGNELNGQTTAHMLGLGGMVSLKKDAIGTTLSQRPEMIREDAPRLMGFRPADRANHLNAGAHFLNEGDPADLAHDLGWMTSVAYSPTFRHSIGLGFIKHGAERIGDTVRAHDPVRGKSTLVEIVSPHMYDPEGAIQRG